MAQLQAALSDVTAAVNDTKKLTDSAFSDLNSTVADTHTSYEASEEE